MRRYYMNVVVHHTSGRADAREAGIYPGHALDSNKATVRIGMRCQQRILLDPP